MDMPFFSGGSGGGSGGTTNYDDLKNKPVTNLTGDPVVISTLESGVYNIEGTWAMTADDEPKITLKDDLFYVSNENGETKLTWITAGKINTYSVPDGGTASDINEGDVPTTETIADDLVSDF